MGKRKKASKPQGPKKRETLATTFQCLFCNHENSVSVKLQKKEGIGQLVCKVCGQTFQTGINYLSAAVDVYSDWIDACEGVANQGTADALGKNSGTTYREVDASSRVAAPLTAGAGGEGNLDGFIDDDDAVEYDEE